jgi:hypothetical protein
VRHSSLEHLLEIRQPDPGDASIVQIRILDHLPVRGVTTVGTPEDDNLILIEPVVLVENVFGSGDDIALLCTAPVVVQLFHEFSTPTGGPPVVHLQDGESERGQHLRVEIESLGVARSGPTVRVDDEW